MSKFTLYFILFFVTWSVAFSEEKKEILAEKINEYNLAFVKSIKSDKDLLKNAQKLYEKVAADISEVEKRKRVAVPNIELSAYSVELHNLTMASSLPGSPVKGKVSDLWKRFHKVVLKWDPKFTLQVGTLGLRGILKDTLPSNQFVKFTLQYRDSIPPELWQWFEPFFVIRPCDLLLEAGQVNEATVCYEGLLKYFPKYDTENINELTDLYARLATTYYRIGNSAKLLALSRGYNAKEPEFEKQAILLFYDRLAKDYTSSDRRIKYLKDLVESKKLDQKKRDSVKIYDFINQYLKTPKPEILAEFKNWIDGTNLDPLVQRRAKATLAEFYAAVSDWTKAQELSKQVYNLENTRYIDINGLYCLSEYHLQNEIPKGCKDFKKSLDKILAEPKLLHWSYLKLYYLFLCLDKKLSLATRKQIKEFLRSPEVEKVKSNDVIIQALEKLYLAL